MLLTIHNLPSSTRYADVKSLLKDKCGLTEVIVDNLVNEGKSKKVTVGLATEDDGAFVVRKLNGLFINGQQLYIEDKRRPTADQPYRPSGLDPVQPDTMMQPVMAPVVPSWNQTVSMPYMQPMPVDQTVVKLERNNDNWSKHSNTNTEDVYIPAMFKEDPDGTRRFVAIKLELGAQTSERSNNTKDVQIPGTSKIQPAHVKVKFEPCTSDIKPNLKIEPSNEYEIKPHSQLHSVSLKADNQPKIQKKEPNNKEPIILNRDKKHFNKVIIKKEDLKKFKEDFQEMTPAIHVSVTGPRNKKRLKKANSKDRYSAAKMITKQIMRIGREHFKLKYGVPTPDLEKRICFTLASHVNSRLRYLFPIVHWKMIDPCYVYQRYGEIFGFEEKLYIDIRKMSVKRHNNKVKPEKPKKSTRRFQNMVDKVKFQILSQPLD